MRAFETLHLPASATLSRATLIRVGELAGASEIVVGTIERQEQQLIVRARTIRLDSGRLNPEVVERGAPRTLGVFERVARKLLGRSAEGPALESRPPLLAFENYVKGLVAESPAAQERYLQRAVELHKEDDRAWLAPWEVWTEAGQHEKALQAARTVPAGSRFARRARFRAGLSELELGRDAEAFTTFKALDSERPALELRNNLGIVQLRRGGRRRQDVPPGYSRSRLMPTRTIPTTASTSATRTRSKTTWLPRCIGSWEAVRRNPADGDAHLVLGAVLEARGSSVEAPREREPRGSCP